MRHSIAVLLLVSVATFACGTDAVLPPGSDVLPPGSEDDSPESPNSESPILSFEVISQVHNSTISSIHDSRRMVIRTTEEWQEFWDEFTAPIAPAPALPEIDFDAQLVIVAAMGERATGGYTIDIEDIREGEDDLTVRVVETSPGTACLLAQVITAPVTAVAVTRREGSVTFDEQAETHECASLSFGVIDEIHSTPISGILDRRRAVIDNAADWEAFWAEFTAALDPTPSPPSIDFDAQMIIVAAMGERATGGYDIAIDDVSQGEDGVAVRVLEISPGPGCQLVQVMTAPITAVTVSRSDGTVTFIEETKSETC